MKPFKLIVLLIALGGSSITHAQKAEAEMSNEAKVSNQVKADNMSYYHQRGIEDAKHEQQFKAETEDEEIAFWENQKKYEKQLKAKDRKAYRAYMRGKRDAYANHYEHCDAHCHHSDHFYHNATFYYYGYNRYESYPHSNGITTRVGISTPNVSLDLF